jgi:3-dehydroquinate dehydratase/shikimate dehydrogenase
LSKICLCLTGKTIKQNVDLLNKYRSYADLAELRVDCLDTGERLYVRQFPELAGIPVILTVRRTVDGGHFTGGEGARLKLLANGLAYANADSRFNFAYVDIEDDFNVPSLEEAARTFGTRIIRSCHDLTGSISDISAKMKSMRHTGDEIVKVAVSVKSTRDVLNVFRASNSLVNQDKILICMGHYGIYSRILAERFGSFLTYTSALSESVVPGAPGQMDVRELSELYRFHKITKKTKIYGITGYPLKSSISPWFFNTIFNLEEMDCVYAPFPTTDIGDFIELANEMNIQGASITVPYKETVLPYLAEKSEIVQSIGACNTMYRKDGLWFGRNTDYAGFSTSLLNFLGRKNLKWQKITIIGAGGVSRSVAAEVFKMGGKVLILNRTAHKARDLAGRYNFRWGGLDEQGIALMSKYNDIIIQTTSVGMAGHDDSDPLELYNFTGKEAVMDLIYTPAQTPFLKRAASAGCRTINGYDMVIRQACLQYAFFFGQEIPQKHLTHIDSLGENKWDKITTG